MKSRYLRKQTGARAWGAEGGEGDGRRRPLLRSEQAGRSDAGASGTH